MANWFNFGITNPHPPDDGIDIGTPSRTPISMPFDCDVIDARWYVYGGQVACAVPGTDYSEYFIHMNNIYVRPGDSVPAGEIIGDSGGGVGDLLLHNGKVQPAKYQSWYEGHSTGPHSEYGIFQGQTMAEFNRGWSNPPRQLDPTPVYEALRNGQTPTWPGSGTPTGGSSSGGSGDGGMGGLICKFAPWLCQGAQQAASAEEQAIAGGLSSAAGAVMNGTAQALGASDFANGIRRGLFMTLGVGVMAVGLFVILAPYLKAAADQASQEIQQQTQMLQKALEGAAVAA